MNTGSKERGRCSLKFKCAGHGTRRFPPNLASKDVKKRCQAAVVFALTAWFFLAGCTPNVPPKAQAGPDKSVEAGVRVQLIGTGLDSDGSIRSHRWEQFEGEPVSIRHPGHTDVAFDAPVVVSETKLGFRYTVTDDDGESTSDEVTVAVRPYGVVNVAVTGTVRSYKGIEPVAAARVTVRQHDDGEPHVVGGAITDTDGRFFVTVPAHPGRLIIRAEARHSVPQSVVVHVGERADDMSVVLELVSIQLVHEFEAGDGSEVIDKGRRLVSLPEDALITELGQAYVGPAIASVTVLDPTRDARIMPGDFVSWLSETDAEAQIESYGAMNVGLTTEDGEPLQLADGIQATVAIPLASGRSPVEAPKTMPLYFWSDAIGYWVKEGEAVLEEVSAGNWSYVGTVTHFTTWNADVAFQSVKVKGCVKDTDGQAVGFADLTARGIDYSGTSSATAAADGRFEIEVRPNSEMQLDARLSDLGSDAITVQSGDGETELQDCLVVSGERGLSDFPIYIDGESGIVEVCVRDHECEDGDEVRVDVEGRTLLAGEIVNDWVCADLELEADRSYAVGLIALNGTGFKGSCSYSDVNTGEIRVSGQNVEMQKWRHRAGAGSQSRIVVKTATPQSFSVETVPINADIELVGIEQAYHPDMALLPGEYLVRVSAEGYESREQIVRHGTKPSRLAVTLVRASIHRKQVFLGAVRCFSDSWHPAETRGWHGECVGENTAMRDLACRRTKERAAGLRAEVVSECRCAFTRRYPGLQISTPGWACAVEAAKEVVVGEEIEVTDLGTVDWSQPVSLDDVTLKIF